MFTFGVTQKVGQGKGRVLYTHTRQVWCQFQAAIEVGTLLDPPAFVLPSAFARVRVSAANHTLAIVFSVSYKCRKALFIDNVDAEARSLII